LNMLEYSTYYVISPEGCATILWKSSDYKAEAAEAMGVTSSRLEELGIVDRTIEEPLGGAHRDMQLTASRLKDVLLEQIRQLRDMDSDSLLERRYKRLMRHGESS
jgi:acetyl-CoA carboxylase carboxyl transferase subunit alpha